MTVDEARHKRLSANIDNKILWTKLLTTLADLDDSAAFYDYHTIRIWGRACPVNDRSTYKNLTHISPPCSFWILSTRTFTEILSSIIQSSTCPSASQQVYGKEFYMDSKDTGCLLRPLPSPLCRAHRQQVQILGNLIWELRSHGTANWFACLQHQEQVLRVRKRPQVFQRVSIHD